MFLNNVKDKLLRLCHPIFFSFKPKKKKKNTQNQTNKTKKTIALSGRVFWCSGLGPSVWMTASHTEMPWLLCSSNPESCKYAWAAGESWPLTWQTQAEVWIPYCLWSSLSYYMHLENEPVDLRSFEDLCFPSCHSFKWIKEWMNSLWKHLKVIEMCNGKIKSATYSTLSR